MLEGYSGRPPPPPPRPRERLQRAPWYLAGRGCQVLRQAPPVCVLTQGDCKVAPFHMDLAQLQQTGSIQPSASLLSLMTGVETAHSRGLSVNPHSPDTP